MLIYFMTLLIFLEILKQFPRKEHASIIIRMFEYLYFMTMAGITYWVFANYWQEIIKFSTIFPVLSFLTYILVASEIINKKD